MPDEQLRRFPGSDRLTVHVDAGRHGRRVRSLAGASDWRRDLVDRAGAGLIAAVGTRALGRTADWDWPACTPSDLVDALQIELPGFRLIGAAAPRQRARERLSLLGRCAGALTVVKLGTGVHPGGPAGSTAGSLSTEAAVLQRLEADPLPGIATARVLGAGTIVCPSAMPAEGRSDGIEHIERIERIEFMATTAVAIGAQRAAIDAPLHTFEADLAVRLADLPRADGTDADAVPIHGDLTPWNLRRTARGLALYDWESAGWGDPGSDLDTYRRACDDVRPAWSRWTVR